MALSGRTVVASSSHAQFRKALRAQVEPVDDIKDAKYRHDTQGRSYIFFEKSGNVYRPVHNAPRFRKFIGKGIKKFGVKKKPDQNEVECWNLANPHLPAKYVEFETSPGIKQGRNLMPFLEGEVLDKFFSKYRNNPKKLFELFLACGKALEEMNKHLAHNDLHAENIFIKEENGLFQVTFIDFEIATILKNVPKQTKDELIIKDIRQFFWLILSQEHYIKKHCPKINLQLFDKIQLALNKAKLSLSDLPDILKVIELDLIDLQKEPCIQACDRAAEADQEQKNHFIEPARAWAPLKKFSQKSSLHHDAMTSIWEVNKCNWEKLERVPVDPNKLNNNDADLYFQRALRPAIDNIPGFIEPLMFMAEVKESNIKKLEKVPIDPKYINYDPAPADSYFLR